MGHLRVIVHGKAAGNSELRAAVKRQREHGHRIEVRVTWEQGDARRYAHEAAEQGADTVVAAGGDGTVNEVAAGLVQIGSDLDDRPSLGIIPLGTANDFATSADVPEGVDAALELILGAEPVAADIGRVGERIFVNMATGGLGAEVTRETPQDLKESLGRMAYLVTGLSRFSAIEGVNGRFRGPGFEWEGTFLVFAVGNGRQAGGGHLLCPEAKIDDGLLDLRILPNLPEGEISTALAGVLRRGLGAVESHMVSARLARIELEAQTDLSVNLDGEPLAQASRRRFEIEAKALRLHLRPSAPLLSG
jgi:lipid kinase YegS